MRKLMILGVLAFQCFGAGASRLLNSASDGHQLPSGTSQAAWDEDRLPPRGSCLNPNHVMYLEHHEQMFNATLQRVFWGYENVVEDEVQRYHVLKIVGAGREGAVAIALDLKTLELVAIKKVLNLFRDTHFTQMVRNEIKVMDLLKESPDVMTLRRIAQPYNWKTFASVFMIIEMMEMEMPRGEHVFRNNLGVEPYIQGERMRRNVFQVLRGLHYLHTAGLVYNDMRFHNIMLDKHCNTRIIDMGMVTPRKRQLMGSAEPLNLPATGDHMESPRDIWMLGSSILVWVGGPDFHLSTGIDADKAAKIVNVVGLPRPKILNRYSEEARGHLLAASANQTSPAVSLQEQLPQVDPGLLDVVYKMVNLNTYANRPSARQLLNHPYFRGLEKELGAIKDGPKNGASSLQHVPAVSAEQSRKLISRDISSAGTEPAAERARLQAIKEAEERLKAMKKAQEAAIEAAQVQLGVKVILPKLPSELK